MDSKKLKHMKRIPLVASVLAICIAVGCSTPSADPGKSNLTHGAVQLNLKKGITTQTEVIEKFGAPNIATSDADGNEDILIHTAISAAFETREAEGEGLRDHGRRNSPRRCYAVALVAGAN